MHDDLDELEDSLARSSNAISANFAPPAFTLSHAEPGRRRVQLPRLRVPDREPQRRRPDARRPTRPTALASPFGWHDTDGVAGPEFTTTQGNNVHAYMDQDTNNAPDSEQQPGRRRGAGVRLSRSTSPSTSQTYRDAATTNLFYTNNMIHDLTYQYGFDEASGNFQVNNYGRGGTGGDYVRAEAADGNGTNNANFSTPANDGGTPRMQMYLWPGNQFGAQNIVTVDGVGRLQRDVGAQHAGGHERRHPDRARSSTPAPAARRRLPGDAADRQLDRGRRRRHRRGAVPVPGAHAGRRGGGRQGADRRPQRERRGADPDRRR